MSVVLGPCRCRDCGATVFWDGWRWTDPCGAKHGCKPQGLRAVARRKALRAA